VERSGQEFTRTICRGHDRRRDDLDPVAVGLTVVHGLLTRGPGGEVHRVGPSVGDEDSLLGLDRRTS